MFFDEMEALLEVINDGKIFFIVGIHLQVEWDLTRMIRYGCIITICYVSPLMLLALLLCHIPSKCRRLSLRNSFRCIALQAQASVETHTRRFIFLVVVAMALPDWHTMAAFG